MINHADFWGRIPRAGSETVMGLPLEERCRRYFDHADIASSQTGGSKSNRRDRGGHVGASRLQFHALLQHLRNASLAALRLSQSRHGSARSRQPGIRWSESGPRS